MNRLFLLLTLFVILPVFVAADPCTRVICGNTTYIGEGNLSGKTWDFIQNTMARNYYNNTHGWNHSQNWTNNSIQYLWFPWYSSSDDVSEGNLKDTYTQSAFGVNANWTINTDVTDESSEMSMMSVLNWTYATFKLWENKLDVCADMVAAHTSQGPWLTSWICTQNNGNITKNDQNSASDATARLALTAFLACKNPAFSAAEQADACGRAMNISRASLAEEWVTSCQNSTVNTSGQLCRWRIAGAAQAFGAGALNQSGQQMFFGYHESDIMHNLAAYAYSHNESFSAAARNETHQFLYVVGFKNQGNTSGHFNYTTGGAHYFMNCTGTPGICITSTTSGSSAMDDSDAPRLWETCNNVRYAQLTYETLGEALPWEFVALRRYCEAWTTRINPVANVTTNAGNYSNITGSGCYRFKLNGTCDSTGTFASNSYKPGGWVSNMIAYSGNASYYNHWMNGSLRTYSNITDVYSGDSAFGVYGQVRNLRSIRSWSGYFDCLFLNASCNVSLYSSGLTYNTTFDASSPSLNLTVNGSTTSKRFELGTLINASLISNTSGTMCITTNHPSYPTNCSTTNLSLILNITTFRASTFNDSTDAKNITYAGASNGTFYIPAHATDDVVNITINLTGFLSGGTTPNGVLVFVNNTLSNVIGLLSDSANGTLTTFNDTLTNKTVNFDGKETKLIGYFYLPKTVFVKSAFVNVTPAGNLSVQEDADSTSLFLAGQWLMNYTKPASVTNNSKWEANIGASSYNATLPPACWNANASWVAVLMYGHLEASAWHSYGSCWNSTAWEQIVDGGTSSGTSCGGCSASIVSSSVAHDGDWNSHVVYRESNGNYYSYTPSGNGADYGKVYEDAMQWDALPNDIWMEVGVVNGSRDFNYSGSLSASVRTQNFSSKINAYLDVCTADSNGFCAIPIYVSSNGGSLNIGNIQINYTGDTNPVLLNVNAFQAYLNASNVSAAGNGSINVPIKIYSNRAGIVQLNDIKYDYRGGNFSLNVSANHSSGANVSIVETFYYGDWNYSMPPRVNFLEFIPVTASSKNVTPYGQTPTRPILNITDQAYGGLPLNFSIYMNESHSCVNFTIGASGNKSNAVQMPNSTWTYFSTNLTYLKTVSLWMWADYGCNTTAWRTWQPSLSFRACSNTTVCSEATS